MAHTMVTFIAAPAHIDSGCFPHSAPSSLMLAMSHVCVCDLKTPCAAHIVGLRPNPSIHSPVHWCLSLTITLQVSACAPRMNIQRRVCGRVVGFTIILVRVFCGPVPLAT